MEKIRLVHFIYALVNGGVESMLLNYFSHMNRDGYELFIVTQEKSDENVVKKFENIGFKVIELNCTKKKMFKYLKEVKKVLSEIKPDIVHSHMNSSNALPLGVSKKLGIKTRISHSHAANTKNSLFKIVMSSLTKKYATHYFACGIDAAIDLYGKECYESGKVRIINNAIDLNAYKYDENVRSKKRTELGLKDEYVICNVGRFSLQKNHRFMIDFIEKIRIPNFKVILIGTGELKEEIVSECKKRNLDKNILFLEKRNDVNEILLASDMFILPSLYEGLPVACIEAQAAGLPTLLSDTITKECAIMDTTYYLSISDPNLWSDTISKVYQEKIDRRRDIAKYFNDKGFNIETEANKLDSFYKGEVR